jgi:cyclophilin family peptidyl-prolyl cis-trans isomerase
MSLTEMGQLLESVVDLKQVQRRPIVECSIKSLPFYIEIRPDWAPFGAERFLELIADEYYSDTALFRALEGFLVQFGLSVDDAQRQKWAGSAIKDDTQLNPPVPFVKGILSFAGSGPNSRETQMFFTLAATDWLGKAAWETPFGRILPTPIPDAWKRRVRDRDYDSMLDLILSPDIIHFGYGEQPDQGKIWQQGYPYLESEFPNLTYMDYCRKLDRNDLFDAMKSTESRSASARFELGANAAGAGGDLRSGADANAHSHVKRGETKRVLDEAEDAFMHSFQNTTIGVEIAVILIGFAIAVCILLRIREKLKHS